MYNSVVMELSFNQKRTDDIDVNITGRTERFDTMNIIIYFYRVLTEDFI